LQELTQNETVASLQSQSTNCSVSKCIIDQVWKQDQASVLLELQDQVSLGLSLMYCSHQLALKFKSNKFNYASSQPAASAQTYYMCQKTLHAWLQLAASQPPAH
jgi:hypothetical protein